MPTTISKDTLWKGIIEDFINEFIQFFFPDLALQIDFSQKIIALDKELEQLTPQNDSQKRFADKLFRVFLKDGEEQWLLIHVEAHGYHDQSLPLRMFQTYYRLQDRYQRPVIALVIYTDENRVGHYRQYQDTRYGTELLYRFYTFVLLDNPPEKLQQHQNIFALILEAAWHNLRNEKQTDDERLKHKSSIVRRLLKTGYSKERLKRLINFVKYYVQFKEPKYLIKFEKEIIKGREPMGITESIIAEVTKQGIKQGIEQGIEQGAITTIKNLLLHKFSAQKIAEIVDLPLSKVETIIRQIQAADTAKA